MALRLQSGTVKLREMRRQKEPHPNLTFLLPKTELEAEGAGEVELEVIMMICLLEICHRYIRRHLPNRNRLIFQLF